MVAVEVVLHDFHRLELFEPGLFGYFVFAGVGVVFQMSHVGDVADVTYFVAYVRQVAVEYVECYGRAGVAEMAVAVDGGSADVHAHSFGVQRFECFFLSCERVVDTELTHWESGVRNEELGAGRVVLPAPVGWVWFMRCRRP